MIAASNRPLSAPSERNAKNSAWTNSIGNSEKGPMRIPAMAMAKPEINATTVAAPRGPKRRPAQPTIGKNTNAIGTFRVANRPHNPNMTCELRNNVMNSARPSPTRRQVHLISRPYVQANTSGAATITPSQSRIHHSTNS